jgi:asparagine synthase (glutamine-hydrolysing)
MCGIVGYLSAERWNLKKAVDSISHRGPDYQSEKVFDYQDKYIGFGHARLSIIDLNSESHQPMVAADGSHSIIYNGEIYNYLNLKRKLEQEGYNFQTESDTEVLLKHYRAYGVDGLRDLKGMFACAIYDRDGGEVILFRDHLGIKPLYYWQNSEGIFWSSELKGIWNLTGTKPPISDHVFEEYLSSGFIYEPNTGYQDVYKIPPGEFLKISLDGNSQKLITQKYWSLNEETTSVDKVKSEVSRSVKSHLVSDVPLGLFYSGGVDSTIILSEIKRNIKSFIVKANKEEYDEAGFVSDFEYGKEIAKHLNADLEVMSLNEELSSNDSILDSIQDLAKLSEEPISDYTFISSMLLSKVASNKGYKVMLSGMGADELFAGYPRYQLLKYGKYFKWIFPIVKPLLKLSKYFEKKVERFSNYYDAQNFIQKYTTLLTPFSRKEIESLLNAEANFQNFEEKIESLLNGCPFHSPLKKAMYLDLYGFLSHNFLVADKSSMQAGLELRVPLATPRLLEMCMNLPDKKLLSARKAKLILKDMLYEILPKRLVDRKKTGFNPPLDRKINHLGKENILNFVRNNGLYNVINEAFFEEMVDQHFKANINNTFKIYRILYLSAWYKENR